MTFVLRLVLRLVAYGSMAGLFGYMGYHYNNSWEFWAGLALLVIVDLSRIFD